MAFTREKLLEKWISASEALDFGSLKELMLLEEFNHCLPDRLNTYLNKQKVTTLTEVKYGPADQ